MGFIGGMDPSEEVEGTKEVNWVGEQPVAGYQKKMKEGSDDIEVRQQLLSTKKNGIEPMIREGVVMDLVNPPASVVILAEFVPTWLPVADSWGCQGLALYCEKEKVDYDDDGEKLK